MKWKLQTKASNGSWSQAVGRMFDGADENTARASALREILWLSPQSEFRMVPVEPGTVSLGAQLWEPCDRCGAEPSYEQPGGHLCRRCATSAHPRVGAGDEPENTTEAENWV